MSTSVDSANPKPPISAAQLRENELASLRDDEIHPITISTDTTNPPSTTTVANKTPRASPSDAVVPTTDSLANENKSPITSPSGSPTASPEPVAPGAFSFPVSIHNPLDHNSWVALFWSTASLKQKVSHFCFNYSIHLSLATQILFVLLAIAIEPGALKAGQGLSAGMSVLLVSFELIQFVLTVFSHLGMFTELKALHVRPGKIWNMYLTTVLSYAALYFTFFCFFRQSFQVDGYAPSGADDHTSNPDDGKYEDLKTSNDIPTVFIFFIYFSGAIMTSTGFGDIAPTVAYTQACTNAQMLMGTMYHVGVFGLTLSHFRTFQKYSEEEKERRNKELAGVVGAAYSKFCGLPIIRYIKDHHWTERIRRFCIRYLVFICLVFQIINTALLFTIPDPFRSLKPSDGARYSQKVVVLFFITAFQCLMFAVVVVASVRLVAKVNNNEISTGFLVQSFLATCLFFGGIYLVLFADTPDHQFSRNNSFDLTVFEVLYVFVHFSMTVMTTTGFGDVYARGVTARIFVLAQMLIAILYGAVIIGLGTSQLIDIHAARAEQNYKKAMEQFQKHGNDTSNIPFVDDDGNPLDINTLAEAAAAAAALNAAEAAEREKHPHHHHHHEHASDDATKASNVPAAAVAATATTVAATTTTAPSATSASASSSVDAPRGTSTTAKLASPAHKNAGVHIPSPVSSAANNTTTRGGMKYNALQEQDLDTTYEEEHEHEHDAAQQQIIHTDLINQRNKSNNSPDISLA